MVLTNAGHHTQIVKGLLDMCLLASIANRPNYGFGLVKQLNELGWHIQNENSIYPVLKRLTAEGLIEAELVPSPSGPARKYHTATAAGREMLAEWIDDWSHVRDVVDVVLAQEPASDSN